MPKILDNVEFDEIYEDGKFTNLTPTANSAQFEQKSLKYIDLSFEPDTLEGISDINFTKELNLFTTKNNKDIFMANTVINGDIIKKSLLQDSISIEELGEKASKIFNLLNVDYSHSFSELFSNLHSGHNILNSNQINKKIIDIIKDFIKDTDLHKVDFRLSSTGLLNKEYKLSITEDGLKNFLEYLLNTQEISNSLNEFCQSITSFYDIPSEINFLIPEGLKESVLTHNDDVISIDSEKAEDSNQAVSENSYDSNENENKEVSSNNSMLEQLQRKADTENDATAANILAIMYYQNNMLAEAEKYFIQASELGYAPAQRNLAIFYENTNNSVSPNMLFQLYEKAALQGDSLALNNLGCCYMDSTGVEQNYEKAAEYFKEAVLKNDDLSTINLGNLYFFGLGVEQNYETAFKYYYKAAELGNVDALKLTANCYIEGYGVEKNYNKALEAFALAAKKGDVSAQVEYDRLKAVTAPHKHSKEVINNDSFDERLAAAKIKTKNQKTEKTNRSKASKQHNKG